MSISSATRPLASTPLVDRQFAKRFVTICGLVPAVLLAWDAYQGQLGVNRVNFAIHTTGLLGLLFLLLSLAITPLRRLTGWHLLIAVRRNLGVLAFAYLVAHFTIYLVFDRAGSLSSALEEIWLRVYLWFGAGALLLMIPLAITSTDGMVTRLGARRWKLLHRLAYPVTIAGVVHFYMLVKSDTSRPIAFAVALGVLLGYRVVAHYVDLRAEVHGVRAKLRAARARRPAKRRFWSGELTIARIFDETPDVKTFRFVMPDGGPLPFEHIAGQYLNVEVEMDGKRFRRSYTIASAPTRPAYCEISVKRISDGCVSRYLHEHWREGRRVKISAPAGRFHFTGEESQRIVLIAGGIGVTPMISVVRSLTDRGWPGEIYLLLSVSRVRDHVFGDELEYLRARFPNLHLLVTISSDPDAEWAGARGRITRELIEGLVPGLRNGPIMVCGPDPMMDETRRILIAMGVPDAEIAQEAFVSPRRTEGDGPAAPMEEDVPVEADGPRTVRFDRAGQSVEMLPGVTVLEAAEDADVALPHECRSGICGQCKTRLLSGRVVMDAQDALTAAERANGLILACQARAVEDLVVDA